VADRISRLVQEPASRGLEELLQTPARGLVLDALFWELGRRLAKQSALASGFSVRCTVTRPSERPPDTYELIFSEGQHRASRGASAKRPALTLTLHERELVHLVTGRTSPLQAVFAGRVRVGGDVGALAALLLTMGE
jgi:alkyl sulfatase BDS1-like metallo-beta-lactamase superfamily hydrolase